MHWNTHTDHSIPFHWAFNFPRLPEASVCFPLRAVAIFLLSLRVHGDEDAAQSRQCCRGGGGGGNHGNSSDVAPDGTQKPPCVTSACRWHHQVVWVRTGSGGYCFPRLKKRRGVGNAASLGRWRGDRRMLLTQMWRFVIRRGWRVSSWHPLMSHGAVKGAVKQWCYKGGQRRRCTKGLPGIDGSPWPEISPGMSAWLQN